MTTKQLTFLANDLASQRRFILQAIIDDALTIVSHVAYVAPPTIDTDLEHALRVIREASAELKLLGEEDAIPF